MGAPASNEIGRTGKDELEDLKAFSVSGADRDSNSIRVYRNKEGERVFKIVNLIQAVESTPEQIEALVSVRNISFASSLESTGEHGAKQDKLCIFCDAKIDSSEFSLFCKKCSRTESQNAIDNNPYYSFL
ncbi:hypothetical protein NEMIN01_0228 [Nematocida minor]|uniref:uncharacterized protein n=1 Tax=Nematocida minor TaxID=1912983 RepID=UPI00221F8E19|nr:uncharacterized protein NEMIN01_0228 [Nematocida minor]KAI5188964.1 hypothetical protein NEMIN01_0228 [Nematocida minor]